MSRTRDSRASWNRLMLGGPARAGADRRIAQPGCFSRGVSSVRFGESRLLDKREIARLREDQDIICSQAKIEATISGARAFLNMKPAMIDFSNWIWELARAKLIQKRRSDSCEYTCWRQPSQRNSCAADSNLWAGDCLRMDTCLRHRERSYVRSFPTQCSTSQEKVHNRESKFDR